MFPIQFKEQPSDSSSVDCHQRSALGNSAAAKLIELGPSTCLCGSRRLDKRSMFSLHGTAKLVQLHRSIPKCLLFGTVREGIHSRRDSFHKRRGLRSYTTPARISPGGN